MISAQHIVVHDRSLALILHTCFHNSSDFETEEAQCHFVLWRLAQMPGSQQAMLTLLRTNVYAD